MPHTAASAALLRATGLLARKGEAVPSLEQASFSDPSLAWGNEVPAPPPTLVWPCAVTRRSVPREPAAIAPEPAPPRAKPMTGARQSFTARLPVELHRRLKVQASQDGRTMTSLVAEALERVLAEQGE